MADDKPNIAGKPELPKLFKQAELKALHLKPGSILVLTAPAKNESEMETYTEVAKVISDEILNATGIICPIIICPPSMKLAELPRQLLKDVLLQSINQEEQARQSGDFPEDRGPRKPPLIVPGRF